MEKRYIERDESGNIVGIFRNPQYLGQSFLPYGDVAINEYYVKVKDQNDKREMIAQRAEKNIRDQAMAELKSEGKLPGDYQPKVKEA